MMTMMLMMMLMLLMMMKMMMVVMMATDVLINSFTISRRLHALVALVFRAPKQSREDSTTCADPASLEEPTAMISLRRLKSCKGGEGPRFASGYRFWLLVRRRSLNPNHCSHERL